MRTKLLQGTDAVTVQLVYPSTLDEYRQALDALGGSLPAAGNGDPPSPGCRPGHAAYVVTTPQQRHLWDLPDLAVSGGVVPVDEPRALDLLHDAAVIRTRRPSCSRSRRGGRFGAGRGEPAGRGSTPYVASSRPAPASI